VAAGPLVSDQSFLELPASLARNGVRTGRENNQSTFPNGPWPYVGIIPSRLAADPPPRRRPLPPSSRRFLPTSGAPPYSCSLPPRSRCPASPTGRLPIQVQLAPPVPREFDGEGEVGGRGARGVVQQYPGRTPPEAHKYTTRTSSVLL
jgi:hypothetical protein